MGLFNGWLVTGRFRSLSVEYYGDRKSCSLGLHEQLHLAATPQDQLLPARGRRKAAFGRLRGSLQPTVKGQKGRFRARTGSVTWRQTAAKRAYGVALHRPIVKTWLLRAPGLLSFRSFFGRRRTSRTRSNIAGAGNPCQELFFPCPCGVSILTLSWSHGIIPVENYSEPKPISIRLSPVEGLLRGRLQPSHLQTVTQPQRHGRRAISPHINPLSPSPI